MKLVGALFLISMAQVMGVVFSPITSTRGGFLRVASVSAPVSGQILQRITNSSGNISITGAVSSRSDIESRFNGGSWSTISRNAFGAFSATLSNQVPGYGLLEVRAIGPTNPTNNTSNIGLGDIFVIAGQSNASGRGTSNQVYSGSPVALLFGNDYAWKGLVDPGDSDVGQVDTVSSDSLAAGSVWPLIATSFLSSQNVPVGFIPCALGGTSITAWLPSGSSTNRASLYGSMIWRAKYAIIGGVRAVLWWQGETDALAAMSQATYYDHFTNFTANVFADLGVKVMPCKLQSCTGIPDVDEAKINAAIGQAWSSDGNTFTGPDLTGLTSNDSFHLQTNTNLQSGANLWWSAMQAALYP